MQKVVANPIISLMFTLAAVLCRYGTIPVVRKTGGLNDTVFDVDDDQERAAAAGMGTNGYSFEGTDPGALDYGLNRYTCNPSVRNSGQSGVSLS